MFCLKLVLAVCAVICTVSAQTLPRVQMNRLVHEHINTQYAGAVTVGGKEYLLVFDTSSPNVILVSEECLGGSCDCPKTKRYSSPRNKYLSDEELTVTYFDNAKAKGKAVEAPVKIVDLTSPRQGIVLVDEVGTELCVLGVDGVVGLAPPKSQTRDYLPVIISNFVGQKEIAPVFSVHHARYSNGSHFGELVFGGSDKSYTKGAFTYVPFVDETSWKFRLDGVRIGDVNVADKNTLAFIDTSKSIILGPAEQVSKINQAIGCKIETRSTAVICRVDCNKIESLPDVTFAIGGRNFNVSAEYYIQQNGNLCYSGFQPTHENYYMIGDYFIDHYYCEFNLETKRMGIAEAVANKEI